MQGRLSTFLFCFLPECMLYFPFEQPSPHILMSVFSPSLSAVLLPPANVLGSLLFQIMSLPMILPFYFPQHRLIHIVSVRFIHHSLSFTLSISLVHFTFSPTANKSLCSAYAVQLKFTRITTDFFYVAQIQQTPYLMGPLGYLEYYWSFLFLKMFIALPSERLILRLTYLHNALPTNTININRYKYVCVYL